MGDKPPARSLIVAPRLPGRPKIETGNPFTSDGDVIVDCAEKGCGWHAMGPRTEIKKAWQEHYRVHHGASLEPGVVLLNNPRQ